MHTHEYPRLDLLRSPRLRRIARSRGVQFSLQLLVLAIYVFLVYAGLYGSQVPRFNIATVGVWTIWWTGVIFLILFLGKAWCYLCPWNAAVTWFKRLRLPESSLRWPRKLKNLYPAAVFLALITWLELGAGITYSPRYTAYLMIAIFILALALGIAYRKRVFCQYLCFIGAIQGIYSTVSPVELRSRDRGTCRRCRTKDCIRGNERGDGCPLVLYPGGMDRSTTSIACMECLRTCPYDNMSLFARPPAAELLRIEKPRMDEAFFIAALLGITLFHGVTMLSAWVGFTAGLDRAAYYGVFSLSLVASVALSAAALYAASLAAGRADAFKSLAYALVPAALSYHLAHNSMHLLMEGSAVIPLISDPLGAGWDLLGTREVEAKPVLPMKSVRTLQLAMVLAGFVISVVAARGAAHRIGKERRGRVFSAALVLIVAVVLLSLWLIYQPMVMRVA
jgi:polyferredoxin